MTLHKMAVVVVSACIVLYSARAEMATTTVTVLAVTPFGEILSPLKVTRFASDRGRGEDYSPRFEAGKASGIPYGEFVAEVHAADRVIAGFVHVDRENALIVLSGPKVIIERGPGVGPGVIGRLAGAGTPKPIWVRLVRVFSEDVCCTIAPVSDDGRFSFGNVDQGDYIFLVLADGRVLVEARVRIDSASTMIEADIPTARIVVKPQ